ncbi:Rpn family recombination-promoting nuclease/putative transposase [Bacillus sp. B15-48]|uniref:Rpn family recombination-promoting nuclease/putative transposase n=1 Tax=Bacillus sp. B15-48 TaxID=1548601 RepID=UPI00193F6CDC|nr:Rpn family recombination-promoting nuclease/putative transposase [Bacillus sp. B15-48]MBM4763113.1 transposase [Bacillus sp. B15-48]
MALELLVREEPHQYIHHDQLFKQLIHTFFAEFLECFFSEVHDAVDFSSLIPLSGEMFTDLVEGESRTADIVIETKLKNEETLIIVHVEPQSYVQKNFEKRMYQYFSLLYNKHKKPVLPIAIFAYNQKRSEPSEFAITFPFFHVLTLRFLKLELKNLNWRNYIHSNNPVAAALLSKMGYSEKEKVQVKKEFLRMLVRLELNPAKAQLINGFFESYLSLNKSEEEKLMKEIKQLGDQESEQIFKLPNSWREKGLIEGRKEAKKEDAIEMLKEGLSIDLIIKITKLSRDEIEKLKKQL